MDGLANKYFARARNTQLDETIGKGRAVVPAAPDRATIEALCVEWLSE